MGAKTAIVGTFVINILIGNICMMPMAMATDISSEHDMDLTEDMMTPMAPMSHADCAHCPKHEEKKAPVPQSSSCAGHCLTQATDNTRNLLFDAARVIAAVPAVIPIPWNTVENLIPMPAITASPSLPSTNTVVLRL